MASFTGVGDNTTLTLTYKGEEVLVNISGTYNMTIAFQKRVGSPNSGAWVTLKSWDTADATVAWTHVTTEVNEQVRLIVTVDTSGTATAYLTDVSVKSLERLTERDELGNVVRSVNERGHKFPSGFHRINDIPINDRDRAVLFEDFHGTWAIGDAGPADLWSSTGGAGAGTAVATTVANSLNGEVTLTSSTADGTHAQNCSTLTGVNLGYKASSGGLEMGARIKIDDISEAVLFIGFTDTISTTVELPIFMNAAAIDSDATDACGLIYDKDATTVKWYVGGVKADTDTDPIAANAKTESDGVYFDVRIEVDSAGVVSAWVDETYIGSVAAAITTTTAVTPAIIVGNRSTNQVIATIDYVWAAQDRP